MKFSQLLKMPYLRFCGWLACSPQNVVSPLAKLAASMLYTAGAIVSCAYFGDERSAFEELPQ